MNEPHLGSGSVAHTQSLKICATLRWPHFLFMYIIFPSRASEGAP